VVIAFETAGTDAMYGKIGQPKQYGIQNCIELETHRLLSSEMGQVIEEISGLRSETNELKTEINGMNQKLDEILKLIQKG
ncbi:8672_t:CDS:1, partial [Rhizophagus irregularis]